MERYSIRLSRNKKNVKLVKWVELTKKVFSSSTNNRKFGPAAAKKDLLDPVQHPLLLLLGSATLEGPVTQGDPAQRGERTEFKQNSRISKLSMERIVGPRVVGQKNNQEVISVGEEWKRRWLTKQIMKDFYGLTEKDYRELKKSSAHTGKEIIENQEKRVEVVMFRAGWVNSIKEGKKELKEGKVLYKDSTIETSAKPAKWGQSMKKGSSLTYKDLNWVKKLELFLLEKKTNVSWLKEVGTKVGVECSLIREPVLREIKLPRSLDISKI